MITGYDIYYEQTWDVDIENRKRKLNADNEKREKGRIITRFRVIIREKHV